LIGLSPLSPGHRSGFQPTSVRPSTGSYPRFSLPRDSSPGFASAARDWIARLGLAFATARLSSLTSPRASNSLAHSTKGTPSHRKGAPTARGRTVSGTVSLPSRGAFHLSLTVLVRYRSQESIQAWRVVPPASDRVSRARPYSGSDPGPSLECAYVALTLCRRPSHAVRLLQLSARRERQPADGRPCNPGGGKAGARIRSPVWPRSPFARRYSGNLEVDFSSSGYLDVSVPRVVLPEPIYSAPG
jgi:hypothetical protein